MVGASVVANKPGADVRGRRSGGFGGDWRGRLDGATWWLCYCPGERKVSDHSACIQSKYESNTPDGAPYRVKQEGSATTMNSTKDSRQRGKLVRYCPGRKKEIQRRVRALKSKYEVNNGPGIHGTTDSGQPGSNGSNAILKLAIERRIGSHRSERERRKECPFWSQTGGLAALWLRGAPRRGGKPRLQPVPAPRQHA